MWARYSFNAFTIYQSVAIWSVCAVASYRKAFTQTDRIFGVVFGDANSHLTVNKVHRCRCTHSAPNRIKPQQQQQNWFRCSRVCQMWPTMSKTFLFFVLFNIRHEIKKNQVCVTNSNNKFVAVSPPTKFRSVFDVRSLQLCSVVSSILHNLGVEKRQYWNKFKIKKKSKKHISRWNIRYVYFRLLQLLLLLPLPHCCCCCHLLTICNFRWQTKAISVIFK